MMPLFNVVLIETQNTCTRKCAFCKFGIQADPDVVEMPIATIERIAEQLAALNYDGRISPFGINEPLLDGRIIQMIEIFRAACPRAWISINTNGDLLTPLLFEALFEAGLDGLGISLYTALARERMQQFLGDPRRPTVTIDMIQPGEKLENRGGRVPGLGQEPLRHLPCDRPFNMLVIRPSGDVVLCCADMYGEVVMGNVQQQSLVEIWNADRFMDYRLRLMRGQREGLKLCEGCSHRGSTSGVLYPFPDLLMVSGEV
jgi:radical SAM protein with 4Fe4S-binding SPASM domain